MSFIDIPAEESGLPSALEQYYKELIQIIGERGGQPILLNNTVTTFDVVADAPFYTEGVFRQFADRKYKHSPQDLGKAVEADRFSFEYERIIEFATASIDQTIDDDVLDKINDYKREIARIGRELRDFEKSISKDWDELAKAEGLNPDMPNYDLRRLNFLETILYADQKLEFTNQIESYRRSINTLRSSTYTAAQQKLLRAYSELAESYKISRPKSVRFERDFPDANDVTFADPRNRVKALFDVSASTYPSSDLVLFQERNDSSRRIYVQEKTEHNELHKKTWGARGGGGFKVFGIRVGGGGRGSGSSSYRREFKNLKSFELNFSGLEEVYANRGLWFDPSLFSSTELKPIIDQIPGARDLEFIAVSLIIGRGLTLKLNFKETLKKENWTRQKFKARGGVSVFGFRFGGSGGSTKYSYDFKLSEDEKAVEFTDDPKHCRLLGVRLERIYHPVNAEQPENRALWSELANSAFNSGLVTGVMSLQDFQQLKIDGFPKEKLNAILGSTEVSLEGDLNE